MTTRMRTAAAMFAVLLFASHAAAAKLSGTVTCKGARDNSDAVVYIDAIAGKTFQPPTAAVNVDQKQLAFVPHVVAVQAGTPVEFLNSDPFLHNVFSPDACCDKFNLGSWPQGQKKSYTFKKECVATLLCNVHPEMEGFVVAVPTPYFAVTDKTGKWSIPDVPAGKYTLKVWHPKLKGTSKSVEVTADTTADFEITR
ncbi:MAG: carboxypeptidase regulatory-like domain-containing protein [Acidobacteria bacterium]|nr:carboxypeptidase regulatory-like domain-containing protein [Acidobacteriota bacterium]